MEARSLTINFSFSAQQGGLAVLALASTSKAIQVTVAVVGTP
jgi:hypothetical protein